MILCDKGTKNTVLHDKNVYIVRPGPFFLLRPK